MYYSKKLKKKIVNIICNSEEECQSLISICEEENVVLMCAYPVRFFPGIIKLKELIDGRFTEHSDYFANNAVLQTNYQFIKKVVDKFAELSVY